jgi:hypothetical protein
MLLIFESSNSLVCLPSKFNGTMKNRKNNVIIFLRITLSHYSKYNLTKYYINDINCSINQLSLVSLPSKFNGTKKDRRKNNIITLLRMTLSHYSKYNLTKYYINDINCSMNQESFSSLPSKCNGTMKDRRKNNINILLRMTLSQYSKYILTKYYIYNINL